jgi:hypothetical protein
MSHSWWLKFLLPDVHCHAFFCYRCAGQGKPGAGNAEKRGWVEYERSRPATRAISSGTTTEAVTRPASGRVDISAVRLRAGSRLSVHQRESYCGYALRHLCCIWMADPAAAAAA